MGTAVDVGPSGARPGHGAAVRYLIDRGLLDAHGVTAGPVTVTDRSSRNANFAVAGPRASFFLKCATSAADAWMLRTEGELLAWLGSHVPSLRPHIPSVRPFDERALVSVFDLVPTRDGAERARWLQRGPEPSLAAQLGEALAALHEAPVPRETRLATGIPWCLWLDAPRVETLQTMSAGFFQLVRAVQADSATVAALVAARSRYRWACVTHGDVKWENLVVRRTRGQRTVVLLDWESALIGDPCWDVGGVLASYLAGWLFREPGALEQTPSALAALRAAHRPMSAFWEAYRTARRLAPAAAEEEIGVAMTLAAARLLQFACEQLQFSATLTPHAAGLLRLAANVLRRPREAAAHLAGIGLHA